jgi:non-homologous end joining protein Ku
MPKAPASNKAVDHTNILFGDIGLIQIPVSIYTGTVSDHGVHRKQFRAVPVMEPDLDASGVQKVDPTTNEPLLRQKMMAVLDEKQQPVLDEKQQPVMVGVFEDHSVGNKAYDKVTGEDVERSEIERKIETEYGFVHVSDTETELLFELPPASVRIVQFQPQHLFFQGHYVPKGLNYVQPAKVRTGKTKKESASNKKALATLLKGMREEGVVAVVEWTTRGLPKPAILLPNGTLWSIYHTDALREQREFEEIDLVEADVEMTRSLIGMLHSTEPLDLTDKRSSLILDFAEKKAAAGDFGKSEEEEVADVETKEASSDLSALLAATIAAQKAKAEAEAAPAQAVGE